MDALPSLPSAIKLHHPSVNASGITLSLINTAAMHPLASGNKLFKLTPNIDYAIQAGFTQILSFGGAFSNHIHALALYGHSKGLQTIGIIRGEPEYATNPTLKAAQANGMLLEFIDRKTYRLRHDPDFLQQLAQKYPHAYLVPEGGSNQLAVEGCVALAKMINSSTQNSMDTIAVSCGTGGTLAGLACGLDSAQTLIGFPVVRDDLVTRIDRLLVNRSPIDYRLMAADYGGYAKFDRDHLDFILDWLEQTAILLDPIYTSKMCRRLIQSIESKEEGIKDSKHIGMIHTGGLQAWFGMREKVIKLSGEGAWHRIVETLHATSLQGSGTPST